MPTRTTNATKTHTTPTTTTPHATTHTNRTLPQQQCDHSTWRLLGDFWSKAIAPRTRRRRRWRDENNNDSSTTNINSTLPSASSPPPTITPTITNNAMPALCPAVNSDHIGLGNSSSVSSGYSNNHNQHYNNNNSSSNSSRILSKYTRPAYTFMHNVWQTFGGEAHPTLTYLAAFLLLLSTCSLCTASPCDSHSWWDPVKDKCIPCTVCQGEMIPLRPCQLHRDTICGSIYDLKIDWVVLAKTEPNWKERRKSEDGEFNLSEHLTHEELQQLHDETMPLDWQTVALFMAVLACLMFFIVAAGILIHHMRQWRRMERRLDQDVEELSTKLMAKLAEVQSLEGGTFYIGNADALGVPTTTFQPQRVQLPEKSTEKQSERRMLHSPQPGNVYIEGHSSKG